MTETNGRPFTISVVLRSEDGQSLSYEGDIEMSAQQKNDLKALIGDGQAKVTVSREYSDKNYGNGGSVFVAVTLTCDQSPEGVEAAIGWANYFADKNAGEQVGTLEGRFQQLGIGRDQ